MKSLLLLFALVVGTNAWATESTYTADFSTNGSAFSSTTQSVTITNNNLEATWGVSVTWLGSGSYWGSDKNGTQIGASKSGSTERAAKKIVISTSDIPGTISSVVVTAASNSSTGTLGVKVGSTSFSINSSTTTTLTGTLTGYTFTGSATGAIEMTFDNTVSGKYFKIGTIVVTYTTGGGGSISTVVTPQFNHGTGTYTTAQNVELSCDTEGATIHYTMTEDGTTPDDPTESDATYSSAISVTKNGSIIKAKAFKEGSNASLVASATYTIQPDQPTFEVSTVVAGKVNRGAQLTMSAAAGNTIIYTTDGTAASYSVPNGNIYDTPIIINNPMTIKAIAVDGYGNESQQAIETYAIYYAGGVDIIPNYTFFGKNAAYSGTTYSEVSGTKDGITITHSKGTGDNTYADGNSMRFYPNNTLTIEAPVGKTITNIVFTQANGQADDMTSTPSGYSATTKTWTGDAASVTFTRTGSSYLKFTNIEVVLANKATIAAACTDGEGMYYGTYSSAKAFKVPADLVVSEIKVVNGKLQLSDYTTGDVVPANTGVLIASDAAGSYTMEIATGGTSKLGSDNMLKPSGDAGITAENMNEANTKFYRLTMHDGTKLGFWWGAENGAAFALAANKAYLAVPTTNSVREGLWIDDDVTAIETVKAEKVTNEYFNLAGQRVAQPTKGLYIVNGRKVVIK